MINLGNQTMHDQDAFKCRRHLNLDKESARTVSSAREFREEITRTEKNRLLIDKFVRGTKILKLCPVVRLSPRNTNNCSDICLVSVFYLFQNNDAERGVN